MPRYLAFSPEQNQRDDNPLKFYYFGSNQLLPMYFGVINSVNVFLGENNSGKSRFMREIMRSVNMKSLNDAIDGVQLVDKANALISSYSSVKDELSVYIDVRRRYASDEFSENFSSLFDNARSNSVENKITLDRYRRQLEKLAYKFKDIFSNLNDVCQYFFYDADELIKEGEEIMKNISTIRNIYKSIMSGKYSVNYHRYGDYGFHDSQNNSFEFSKNFWSDSYYGNSDSLKKFTEKMCDALNSIITSIADIQQITVEVQATIYAPPTRTYIPTLRTARTLIASNKARLESANDIFSHTTQHDYGLADSGVIVDTGFGLYEAVDTTRNARHKGRTSFKAFEQFLSTTFFNGKTVEVVAERVRDERGGNILVSVGGVERDIHDLGDGIQAIIMLLYPLFIAPDNAWFFIEEPETHLHPGFQRLFIETITTNTILRKKQLTIFLTTHSNHILDFALNGASLINLFTFRRQEGKAGRSSFQIQLSAPRDLENLNALGVQNSSVFLANCTLWVEGITDRLYLRAYLQAYWKHLQSEGKTVSLLEGLHYTFLEYAGANVEHYYFDELAPNGQITPAILSKIKALSVANRIMLIADQDAGKQTRHEARTQQQHAGFFYYVLSVREIENLLTPAVLVETLQGLYKKQTFDAAGLRQSSYTSTYIGKYLRSKFSTLPDGFAPEKGSGTIGSSVKRKFAEEAVKHIKWDSMSQAAQKLTKDVHNFIMAHNPRLGSN